MTEARAAEPREAKGFDFFGFIARFAPTFFLIALMVLFALIEPRFLSEINLFNVMRQVSITGLLAVGMTFVILTAGIDLSIGSLLAFAGLVAAAIAKGGLENRFTVSESGIGYGWGLAALAAIAIGLAGGYLQGLAITRLKVPPFVVTLGGMSAFRGAALLFAAGGPISGFQPSFTWWGQGKIGPVPCRSSFSSPPLRSRISRCAIPATAGRSTPSAAIPRRRASLASTSTASSPASM